MWKDFQGVDEGLSQRPSLASPQQKIAGDRSKNHILQENVDVNIVPKPLWGSCCGVGRGDSLRNVIVVTEGVGIPSPQVFEILAEGNVTIYNLHYRGLGERRVLTIFSPALCLM